MAWTDWLEKHGSTALVRQIAKGALSPQSIQRAAAAMPAGKFRFINNLGRGQFNLADRVVGNVGGHAGEMVRKLPTRQVGDMVGEYAPFKSMIQDLNQQHGPGMMQRAWGYVRGRPVSPPIAPYVAATPRGGFQQLATGYARPSKALVNKLDDLHPGNIGPNGQIIDFAPKATVGATGMSPTPLDQQFQMRLIDPAGHMGINRRMDLFGNVGVQLPHLQAMLKRELPQSNNLVRKYWAQTPLQREFWNSSFQQRPAKLRLGQISQDYDAAMGRDLAAAMQATRPKPPSLPATEDWARASQPTSIASAPAKPSWWNDEDMATVLGTGAGAGAAYGGYDLYNRWMGKR